MKLRDRRPLLFMVLAAFSCLTAPTVSAEEEPYICGTPDDLPGLAKSADLPRISKVYSGVSTAIMVRIAFANVPYTVTDSTIAKTHAAINAFYSAMSRNTFKFDFKVHPEIWTAPGTKASYDSDFRSLQTFISGKLKENGYVKGTNYTVYVASFPQLNLGWAGLSNGPSGGGDFINGSYGAGVTAHELGHSVGLPHAHSIEPCPTGETCNPTDIFGTPGDKLQHVEYGNVFDVMGNGGIGGHFNVNYKWRTGWIDANEMMEIKNSGTYRIYASDNSVHKNRLLGIRIPSVDTRYAYWMEYRSVSTTARTGAILMFEGFNGTNDRGIHLLDVTPQSRTSSDARDALLVPGKEVKDKYGTATIKTVAINSGVWDENGWVDVQVTIPGTVPILAMDGANKVRLRVGKDSPAYNLAGRRIADLLDLAFIPATSVGARVILRGGR